jgi:uncharacterized membrane protein
MTLRNILLTLHILVALLTIGWLTMQAMLSPRAIRAGSAEVVRFSIGAARKVGPLSALVFVLGLWLVLRQADDHAEFEHTWVNISMTLFIVATVIGAVFGARAERAALAKLEAGQDASAEAGRVAMLGGINMIIVTVITYLMVAKPGIG